MNRTLRKILRIGERLNPKLQNSSNMNKNNTSNNNSNTNSILRRPKSRIRKVKYKLSSKICQMTTNSMNKPFLTLINIASTINNHSNSPYSIEPKLKSENDEKVRKESNYRKRRYLRRTAPSTPCSKDARKSSNSRNRISSNILRSSSKLRRRLEAAPELRRRKVRRKARRRK